MLCIFFPVSLSVNDGPKLFGLIGLIGVDSFGGGKIVKSVVMEVLESVNNVLFRSESCLYKLMVEICSL